MTRNARVKEAAQRLVDALFFCLVTEGTEERRRPDDLREEDIRRIIEAAKAEALKKRSQGE